MWIEERQNKDGTKVYKFNERYIDQRTLKRKKVSVTYSNKSRETQKLALYALNDKIDELQNKKPAKTITFGQLVDEWMKRYKEQVRQSTYFETVANLKAIRRYIDDKVILQSITEFDLNNLFDGLIYNEKLSNSYVLIIKTKLSLIFKYALKRGYIENNPLSKVQIEFRKNSTPKKITNKFLEDDEYKSVISFLKKNHKRYYLLTQWLYLTGMRIGEATALQISDVILDNDRPYANINGTLVTRGLKSSEYKKSDVTKTPAGMRKVFLSKKAIEVYESAKMLSHGSDFLFTSTRGHPINVNIYNSYLKEHFDDFKISNDKPLSSHIFRHTHISKLAELGVPLYIIKERVGHESSATTESIYTHVTSKAKEKYMNKLDEM